MSPIIISYQPILDKEFCLNLVKENEEFIKNDIIGIYFENLKNIRIEALSILKQFSKIFRKKIILFSIPNHLRIYFFLESIPLRIGCAFFE